MNVRVQLRPDGPVTSPPDDVHHAVMAVPGLEDLYKVRAVLTTLQSRVRFNPDGTPVGTYTGEALVTKKPEYEAALERDVLVVPVLPADAAIAGQVETLLTQVKAVQRWDQFDAKWIDLDDQAPAMTCNAMLDCTIG